MTRLLLFALAGHGQFALARLFSFPRLACKGFFNGLEYALQLRLLLLACFELLVATGQVFIEFGQRQLALLTDFGQLRPPLFEAVLLLGQRGLLLLNTGFDAGQLTQRFIEAFELLEAGFAEVVVVGQGAAEFFRILLVE